MKYFNRDTEFRYTTILTNLSLLFTHALLIVLFYKLNVSPMVYINIGSVSLYCALFVLLWKKKVMAFYLAIIFEVLLHLIAATICVGMECGFEQYCFGLISIIYFTKYIYIWDKHMRNLPIIVAAVSVTTFIGLGIYTNFMQPRYPLSPGLAKNLFLMNSVLIFLFISVFLFNFTRVAILSEESLHNIADFDELTRIYTRRKIHEVLATLKEKSDRTNTNFCITILDVDNFKTINDTYGHNAGDFVLKTIAQTMQASCTATGSQAKVARWGGDEFLVVQEYNSAKVTAESCRQEILAFHKELISHTLDYQDMHLAVSMTGGFAAHQKGSTIEETFKSADANLYKGKENGKNQVV